MIKIVSTQRSVPLSFSLLVGTTYFVGRRSKGDITIRSDDDITHVYAKLEVQHPRGNLESPLLTPPLLAVMDINETGIYATEDNIKAKIRLGCTEQVLLSIGTKLCFRNTKPEHEFRVDYTPLVVVSSGMDITDEFKEQILRLGGHFMKAWTPDTTHLVMENVTGTTKTICALLTAKPIVTASYITVLLAAFESLQNDQPGDLPNPQDFLPPVIENEFKHRSITPENHMFFPNMARLDLFAGKTFIFCSEEQMEQLGSVVIAGGGTAKLVVDADQKAIFQRDHILMGGPLDIAKAMEISITWKTIIGSFRTRNKRYVTDMEIVWAALTCSMDVFCNPFFPL